MSIICGDLVSPTKCAENVYIELLAAVELEGPLTARKDIVVRLVRQIIRDQYEHCAQLAECYVPEHDLNETLTGLEVCDGIAETIRKLADERVVSIR